jgi:hypothetical protein
MGSRIGKCFLTGDIECHKEIRDKADHVFLAIPFTEKYHAVSDAIVEALQSLGYKPFKADESTGNISIFCKICQGIQEAKYVVCEVTEWNPNVFLELGMAIGLGKYVVLLREEGSKLLVPSDLRGVEHVNHLGKGGTKELKRSLRKLFTRIITKGYPHDPYLVSHDYRVKLLNLTLDVEETGDTRTEYEFYLQSISRGNNTEPVRFRMPYHDTPSEKTTVADFNLKAKLLNPAKALPIDWILQSNVWKRFSITLPPLDFEQIHNFKVSMFERSLLIQDEEEEFYDVEFYYPTEKAIIKILFPHAWDFTDQRVVIAETGEPAPKVRTEKIRTRHKTSLNVDVERPEVGSTYLLIWRWVK